MYARLTTFHIPISKTDEAVDIYKNSIIPAAENQEGFVEAYFLINKNAGKFISMTVWQDVEFAVANQKTGYYQAQIDKLAHLQVVSPEIEGYEVAARECKI
ncbi:MAG: hypothetical protein K9J12_15885 [Melioribacteraceae bacterium]|nr:hypothetical protein [Melioribacteraceae bacterium]MCF8263676.1 hypothetical protein [Melioribacteraceae bacterium]MCF8431078.1 hypothetical protein [Melioribacteraceae bacterium]